MTFESFSYTLIGQDVKLRKKSSDLFVLVTFKKTISDISQRMLTVTLRTLEADGLVSRTVYAEVPPRVEYQLTETGKTLIPHIESLVGWALEHMTGIFDSREKAGQPCG